MIAAPVIPPKIWTKARILARKALSAPTRNMPSLWSEERRATGQCGTDWLRPGALERSERPKCRLT